MPYRYYEVRKIWEKAMDSDSSYNPRSDQGRGDTHPNKKFIKFKVVPKKMELSEEEMELWKWRRSKMKSGACVRIPLNRKRVKMPE